MVLTFASSPDDGGPKPPDPKDTLKYKVFRHQHRNITMVFIMETPMRFNDIKASMLTWLKKQNYMMTRHNFNTKTLDIVKIGFLVGKHPTDTHQETLHQEINMKMNQLMQEMTPDQNESIRATHIGNPDIRQTPNS
jgi:hypothetical protein